MFMQRCFDYLYDKDSVNEIKKWIKDYSREEALKFISVDQGLVLPRKEADKENEYTWMGLGGVIDKQDRFVELSGIKHILADECVFGGKYDYDATEVMYCDEDVIYIGPFFNHWGHFLYDFITRLWYALDNTHLRLAYCGWGFDEGTFYGSYGRFFDLLGINRSRLIDIRKPTRFKSVIVPEQSYLRNEYVTDVHRELLKKVSSNVKCDYLTPYEKVYFTRDSFIKCNGWYREHGERIVAETFAKNGYIVLDPATLSLDEQIFYVSNCKIFACVASSTGADTFFMPPNTDRIYIKKGKYMDSDLPQVDILTDARNVDVIDCWIKPYKSYIANHSTGPHLIGMTEKLRDYLRDHGMETLAESKYRVSRICTYIWFIFAKTRNVTFDLLYSVYSKTLRRLIR